MTTSSSQPSSAHGRSATASSGREQRPTGANRLDRRDRHHGNARQHRVADQLGPDHAEIVGQLEADRVAD